MGGRARRDDVKLDIVGQVNIEPMELYRCFKNPGNFNIDSIMAKFTEGKIVFHYKEVTNRTPVMWVVYNRLKYELTGEYYLNKGEEYIIQSLKEMLTDHNMMRSFPDNTIEEVCELIEDLKEEFDLDAIRNEVDMEMRIHEVLDGE